MSYFDVTTVCFDYYGTLVDVGEPFLKIKEWFVNFLEEQKTSVSPERFYTYFAKQQSKYQCGPEFLTGMDILTKSYLNACQKYDLKPCIEPFEAYIAYLFTTPIAFADAKETIRQLKKKYRVGLVTNADNHILWQSIVNQNFTFHFVVTSEDARCNKPGKAIFEQILKTTSGDKVLMVGDSLREDMIGANSLGMHTLWLNRKEGAGSTNFMQVKSIKEILNYL